MLEDAVEKFETCVRPLNPGRAQSVELLRFNEILPRCFDSMRSTFWSTLPRVFILRHDLCFPAFPISERDVSAVEASRP